MIYFIRDGKHVKIGYTQDEKRLDARIRTLQVGNPRNLSVLAVMKHGGPLTEKNLHEILEPWRVSGEWFELSPAVQSAITAAANGALPNEVVAAAKAARTRAVPSMRAAGWIKGRTKKDHAPEVPAIFSELKRWRKQEADAIDRPAYAVASDSVLRELSHKQPTTLTAMQTVRGIGPAFIRKYGQSCLTVIEEAARIDS